MIEEFITYKKFNNKNSAEKFGQLLEKEKIEYILENNSLSLDASLTGNNFGSEFCVKINKSDFKIIDEILEKNAEEDINEISSDYYLLTFSDEELIDIITKSDEWSTFDVSLAKKMLKEKGKEVTKEEIENIQNKRLLELSKPEKSQNGYIIAGYIFAILGGWLSIFIGWHLLTYKKTLPNGTQVYAYSENDRKQGNRIFIIGITFLVLWSLYFLFK
ncbi:hypothetical protein [Flavobacterium sp.]|uniref:hypothetical protein n=1 Tax=Flavobacterium sp. TaxID=239 RepID=UPI00374D4557